MSEDYEAITLCVEDGDPLRIYTVAPWPRRVTISLELLDRCPPGYYMRTNPAPDGEPATVHIEIDNGRASYRRVDVVGPCWFGDLIHSTYQPAPPELAAAVS